MGQAKQRGTFEQRKAEGEAKRQAADAVIEEARIRAQVAREEQWAAMSKKERQNHVSALGILAGLGVTATSIYPSKLRGF